MKIYVKSDGEIVGFIQNNLVFYKYDSIEQETEIDVSDEIVMNKSLFNYSYQDGKLVLLKEIDQKMQEAALDQMILLSMRTSFLNELPDEQAKEIPLCFDSWDSFSDGYEFKEGQRVEHKGGLWKCKKGHKKQASWYPGADPTLFEQLDKDEHAGTLEDPIPVPDSVTTSGFTYVYGKHYIESAVVYLFKRGGIPDEQAESMYGQKETLYFPPSSVVGTYTVRIG